MISGTIYDIQVKPSERAPIAFLPPFDSFWDCLGTHDLKPLTREDFDRVAKWLERLPPQ